MKFAIAALLGLTNATLLNTADIEAEKMFLDHLNEFGKSYGTVEEFQFRKNIFMDKLRFINEWNAGKNTHQVGVNQFMTWTDAEYKKILGGFNIKTDKAQAVLDDSNLKDGVNWVTEGKVSPVKNQGQCGSCWSFATTGSMESANVIQNGGEMVTVSEQQFVDCDTQHDMGCQGGNPVWAYQYASQNPIMRESAYPYIAKKNSYADKHCDDAMSEGVLTVTDFDYLQSKPASQFQAAIAKQPVAILVEADKQVFQLYRTGVLTSEECGTRVDHAVLAAGYGTDEEGQDYFLVKNSWSASWGDNGYLKIGTDNVCGILSLSAWPQVSAAN